VDLNLAAPTAAQRKEQMNNIIITDYLARGGVVTAQLTTYGVTLIEVQNNDGCFAVGYRGNSWFLADLNTVREALANGEANLLENYSVSSIWLSPVPNPNRTSFLRGFSCWAEITKWHSWSCLLSFAERDRIESGGWEGGFAEGRKYATARRKNPQHVSWVDINVDLFTRTRI